MSDLDNACERLRESMAEPFGTYASEPEAPLVLVRADDIRVLLDALATLRAGVLEASDRFFREAMPKMNIAKSPLDANAIVAWNEAELAIARAKRELARITAESQ